MHLKLLLESNKNVMSYYEKQNSYLLNKIKSIFKEFKHDYSKLLKIVKEKEREIIILDQDLKKKKENIFSLEDRLLSINILEKKINVIDEKYQRDIEKMKEEYEANIKNHFAEVQKDPYFNYKIKEKEDKVSELKSKILNENLDKSRLIGNYERTINNLQKNNRSLQIRNNEMIKQLTNYKNINVENLKESYLNEKFIYQINKSSNVIKEKSYS